MRKGIGRISLFDHDRVELSNLPRQFFGAADVGLNKALALAKNLSGQATGRTLIEGHACNFQQACERGLGVSGSIAVVGVDNNMTRLAASEFYLARAQPVVFLAVDDQASRGYVFIQASLAGTPCFLCLFPDAREDRRVHQCAGASVEILKIVAGIALYAIDSLLMQRPRPWNYKEVFLDSSGDGHRWIAPRSGCSLCDRLSPERRNCFPGIVLSPPRK